MTVQAVGPATIRVGVTGHRKLGPDPRTGWYVHVQCVRILIRLQELACWQEARLVAYSALAEGADQLFAQAALGLGIPLVGVIPFKDYADDFTGEERDQFGALLDQCQEVHRLPLKRRSNQAYLVAGQWVVDQAEYVMAVWDGRPAAGKGGTGDVVAYAQEKGRAVLRIDPGAAPGRVGS